MKNVSDKSFREDPNTHFMFNNFLSFSPLQKLCHLWDNVEKYCIDRQATDDNILWHMHIAWWITKSANTHSDSVILAASFHHKSGYMYVAQC